MSTRSNNYNNPTGLTKILKDTLEQQKMPTAEHEPDESAVALGLLMAIKNAAQTGGDIDIMQQIVKQYNAMRDERDIFKSELDNERSYDQKTGLHSQKFFDDRLRYTIERLKRAGTGTATLIAIDLNNFSTINNSHGHHIGDKALIAYANTLGQLVRSVDVVARSNTAGDEFFILFEPETKEQAHEEPSQEAAVERLKKGLERVSIELEDQKIHITGSLGIIHVTANDTIESAKERSDKAMYVAKKEFKRLQAASNNTNGWAPTAY